MAEIRRHVTKDLFLTRRPLRLMLLELMKMCAKLGNFSLLNMQHEETYALPDFVQAQVRSKVEGYILKLVSRHSCPFLQITHLEGIADRFRTFNQMVIEMTVAACRAALIEEGFSPDKYPEEMEFYMQQLEIPVHQLGKVVIASSL